MSHIAKLIIAGAAAAALAACGNGQGAANFTPSAPIESAKASPEATMATASQTSALPTTTSPKAPSSAPIVVSDVSKLVSAGIDLRAGVLIDVADDGVDRFLQVGENGVVDFTGTAKTDSTMMSLQAAPVAGENLVVIKPPFWNEEVGTGYCVADTVGAALKLETCKPGDRAQTWRVIPAGDSGQFELEGRYGIIRVVDGLITTGNSGRTGLQTLPFTG